MNINYNEIIPQDALTIIEQLEANGYEAYIVGGCVRDMLMNREPNDWDITTSARPEQVKEVFNRTYDTGIEHGTVTVILEDQEHYEITTYRVEGEYKDFRRPDTVDFVDDINEDLSRRDFTMNAIAYHPMRGFVDPYNGRGAIEKNIIRSVREAKERFTEDALRILRAIRFSAQLGFDIDKQTLDGIKVCRHLLQHISKERIRDEFLKICLSDQPNYIYKLYEMQLLEYIIPELIPTFETAQNHPYHIYNVGEHMLVAMQHVPKEPVLRVAVLLHDIGKPKTKTTDKKGIDHFYDHPLVGSEMITPILKDLRFDNNTIKAVYKLVKYHDYHIVQKVDKIVIKKMLRELGVELFDKMLILQEADGRAQAPDKFKDKQKELANIKSLRDEIITNNECYDLKTLALNGGNLIKLGIPKGKALGEMLEQLLEYVLREPNKNTKEDLQQYIALKRS